MSKIMRVFYDNAGLPYKDSALSIHYPILEGGEFVGANNTTDIYFYTANLGDFYFVANCKLPNGALVDKLLVQGSDEFGDYFALSLDSELTENKGHLKVALKGYGGNVDVEEEQDGDTTIVVINGTPTIVATGIVDIAINYAPLVHYISSLTPSEYEQLLGAIGGKLDIIKGIYVVNTIGEVDLSREGQIYYIKTTKELYQVISGVLTKQILADYVPKTSQANKVYATDGSGNQTTLPVDTFYEGNIARRDTDNSITVPLTPTENGHAASKGYVDGNFVKKYTTSGLHVYTHIGSTQQEIEAHYTAERGVAIRGDNGVLSVGTPTSNDHATTKLYVDGFAKNLTATLDRTTYVLTITLKDANGVTLGTEQTIDLPLESIVTSATYYNNYTYDGVDYERVIVITLYTTPVPTIVPVGDLIVGLIDQEALDEALEPYIKTIEVNSVLSTNDLLTNVGVGKPFVLDVMGDTLLCYINETENEGYYTMSVVGKHTAYTTQTFTNAELVTNILGTGTLEINYLPIVTLTTAMQTLNSDQLQVANQDNSVIRYENRLYNKSNDSGTTLEFVSIDYDIVDQGDYQQLTKYEITVNKSTGATNMITMFTQFYSKGESDTLLEEKANVDGNYPTMTVGAADNLTPYGDNSGVEGTTPFVMQTTGGNSDVGSQGYQKALRGNSVKWNQLISISGIQDQTLNGITLTNNGDGSYTLNGTATAQTIFTINPQGAFISGHKYLVKGCPSGGSVSTYNLYIDNFTYNDVGEGFITTLNTDLSGLNVKMVVESGTTVNNIVFRPQLFDLTMIFSAGNEPTSVVEFNRLYPKQYYEYNAGQLLSCKVNGIKNVGYNAYDNSNPNDYIRVINGQTYTLEGTYTSVELYDYNKDLLVDTFTSEVALPNNCCFVKIIGGDNTTCFHLTHDGSKTGYELYNSQTYALPNIELRSAGNTYDELKPNGTLITKIGVVDLGTLSWAYDISTGFMYSNPISTPIALSGVVNALCEKYEIVDADKLSTSSDKSFTIYDGKVYVKDSAYNDADVFKNAMSGVMLFYELATPVTTQNDEYKFDELMPVDDWGTQEYLYDSNISIPIPQGNDFFYPVDYKAFIDSLGGREDINYDASQIVSQEQLTDALSDIDLSGYAKIEQGFNVINGSDIVNNTLTQAQRDLIINGKPTRISGAYGNLNNIILMPPSIPVTDEYEGFAFAQINGVWNTQIRGYRIRSNLSFAISSVAISMTDTGYVSLPNLEGINGKNTPNYPTANTSPQYLQIGANGGNLSWSDDGLFNVINASDIINNTLTDAQYALITNGKPTLIKGTFLQRYNMLLICQKNYGAGIGRFLVAGYGDGSSSINYTIFIGEMRVNNYVCAINSSPIQISNQTSLENILTLNSINIAQYYKQPQSSVSLSDGGTITDNALKLLIQNEQPIKLNGFTCYFSCDDGTNYQYTSMRYDANANKNHINVITIDKSTWVATFHTSDIALN